MKPGPARKPAALTLISGTGRGDRPREEAPDVETLKTVPEVPAWIAGEERAAEQWRRITAILIGIGNLAEQDLDALAHYCMLHSRLISHWKGERPTDRGLSSLLSQYKTYAAAFGLAPAWRVRVGSGKETETKNPFTKFKKS